MAKMLRRTCAASLVCLVTLLCCGKAALADWETGRKAADAGDFAKAIQEWLPLAKNGDARAQYAIGALYRRGDGFPRDDRLAAQWIRMAAEQGYSIAQYDLGVFYANGRGVTKDGREAVKWYERAAAQGDVDAQYNLGQLYWRGDLVERDLAKAGHYYSSAAHQGDTKAQTNLGQMFLLGKGMDVDNVWAYVWLSLALVGTPAGEIRTGLISLRDQAASRLSDDERRRADERLLECIKTRLVCGN